MLQQTQAARVVDPYVRFVARFPTPGRVRRRRGRRRWCGPGRASATTAGPSTSTGRPTVVVERHGGQVPADLSALRALPGVGPYTARAVLAFAFEADTGVVDTNVARVLARAVAGAPAARRTRPRPLADDLVPAGPVVGLQPGALRPRGPALHGPAPRLRRLPAGAAAVRWARSGWRRRRTRRPARPAGRQPGAASTARTARAGAAWWPRSGAGPLADRGPGAGGRRLARRPGAGPAGGRRPGGRGLRPLGRERSRLRARLTTPLSGPRTRRMCRVAPRRAARGGGSGRRRRRSPSPSPRARMREGRRRWRRRRSSRRPAPCR